jgi:NAD(P)-dependent dehydrogenase (short-subunit alcohol dehydrogenase family)
MQKGQHIGKIVVSMALDSSNSLPIIQAAKAFTPDPDAAFLLVGGLGGLGKSISTWMVENGARHLVYLSRSAGTSNADTMFKHELESQGCSVTVIKGSVTQLPDVEAAVTAAKGSLKGVLQMSMVLRDQAFPRMTYEEWTAAVAPKVQGTWNLHQATLSCPLDFFVCFSSVSGVIGQPGQANYAAGNTFLDAFVQYRRSQNLPASSIDIGAMEDAGYLAENKAIREKVLSTGACK